jgi:hypothetical protein
MKRMFETLGALWELFRIAARSGFRLRSNRYWQWRRETAFGRDPDRFTTRRQRFHAMIDYGRWVRRMRRNCR